MRPVYFDNAATTPVDPRVLDAMLPFFKDEFGNAASRNHAFGWHAEEACEKAREQIAAVINASPKEIVFTSGATESNNIAIKGVAAMYAEQGRHIITSTIEHKAVIDPCKYLEQQGCRVTFLDVEKTGQVSVDALKAAAGKDTILVSVMFANNEIGTINRIAEIGAFCKEKGIIFHTDATQAFGKVPIDVEAMGIDLLSLSAHKIYGPKGIGALYVRRRRPRVRVEAAMHGGGHERGMRSGTLNVPGIVGLGMAAELALKEMPAESARLLKMRERLEKGLASKLDAIHVNGHPQQRLPNILNMSFLNVEGEGLMMSFKDVAVSSGSACTSASLEPSYVLKGLGLGDDLAHSSIRFSMGRFNTEAEVDRVVECVSSGVSKLRRMSPLQEMVDEGIDLSTVEWAHH